MSSAVCESRLPVGSSARISGLVDQRPRDRHALLLAAGQLGRRVVHAVAQAHLARAPPARARAALPRSAPR